MRKKHIALTLKFLVSGGLIWMLVDGIDLGSARDRILGADVAMLGLVLLVSMLQICIGVARWRAVLAPLDGSLSFFQGLRFYCIGIFFNQVLPSSVGGDAVRVYMVYKSGMTLACSINGVMLERVATVLGLILLVVLATPFFIDRVGPGEAAWIVPAVAVMGVAGLAGLIFLMFLDRLPARFSHWRLVRGLAKLAADSRRVFLSPRHGGLSLGWSLLGNVNIALMVYLLALSLDVGITWLDTMVLMPPVLLITIIPVSIAGWGVREGAMVAAFALIGAPADGVLVLSIAFGLIGLLIGLPGGIVWLLGSDRKIEDIGEIDDK